MMLAGMRSLRAAADQIRSRFESGAIVLLYHRIAECSLDPQMMCVTSKHFAEHLEVLRKYYCPMKLQELTKAHGESRIPNRAVAVTFDDGYADNLSSAKPLLEQYDIPATVFVTTGSMGETREFWWDELDRILLQSGTLPKNFRCTVNGSTLQFDLGKTAHYDEETYRCHLPWNVQLRDSPTSRHELYRLLCDRLRPLPVGMQSQVLDELRAWSGAKPGARSTHRALSTSEVLHLPEGPLIEVGSHTVTHPVLSLLPSDEQEAEIQQSKVSLEEILGKRVSSFAYPYGARSDYTKETVAIVARAGFDQACANFLGVVWSSTDKFQLPRVLVRNWDGESFARQLRRWIRG